MCEVNTKCIRKIQNIEILTSNILYLPPFFTKENLKMKTIFGITFIQYYMNVSAGYGCY